MCICCTAIIGYLALGVHLPQRGGGRDNIAYMHTQILIIYVHAGNMSGRNVLGPMEKCPMGKVEAGMSGVMSP